MSPTDNEIFTFTCDSDGARADSLVSEKTGLSRSVSAALIESGACTVNGIAVRKNRRLKTGDMISVIMPQPEVPVAIPQNIPLDIVYEDGDVLVVNKPKGMVVHPAAGHPDGTLVNALLYHCANGLSGINGVMRPGIVHRIDRNTSGLLAVAKTDAAHEALSSQISAHSFTREYMAVVKGAVSGDGTVDAPIGRSRGDRKKMCVTELNSKPAVTHYYTVRRYQRHTLLRLRLETGRTHQIRVHMAYIGHPVAGDDVYGDGSPKWLCGQCLHAKKIGFVHPDGRYLEFDSELPDYFTKMLTSIENTAFPEA